MDRVLDKQRVQPGGGVLAVAFIARDKEGTELAAELPQRIEIVAGPAVEVLPVGDQLAQPGQAGQSVTVFAPSAGRVDEPYREFSVGVKIHSSVP